MANIVLFTAGFVGGLVTRPLIDFLTYWWFLSKDEEPNTTEMRRRLKDL